MALIYLLCAIVFADGVRRWRKIEKDCDRARLYRALRSDR
jgi:hypothetical protein